MSAARSDHQGGKEISMLSSLVSKRYQGTVGGDWVIDRRRYRGRGEGLSNSPDKRREQSSPGTV